jgi:hypothetical protein
VCFPLVRHGKRIKQKIKDTQTDRLPCGGGFEYLHRGPASRRRRRKEKSRIWDSKIWSRVPRDSDPRMTALARTSSNCKWQTRPLVRESVPHQQTRNCLINKNLVVSPRWVFYSKTDWPTDRRSKHNFDFDFDTDRNIDIHKCDFIIQKHIKLRGTHRQRGRSSRN